MALPSALQQPILSAPSPTSEGRLMLTASIGAAGAGAAIGRGAGGIVLTNQNGAVLTLSGRQSGLIVAADLNGLVITLR